MNISKNSGLYLHIPFCRSKCPYCSFYSVKYDKLSADEYIERLIAEMSLYSGEFDTVYFGGGTPSILESKNIVKTLEAAKRNFKILPDCEITIECNPSKNLERDFCDYAAAGINRVSLGMQSAVDSERLALGRLSGSAQVKKAIVDAKNAGINNISLDVMLATPGQTLNSLDETFDFISKAEVTHISAYMLKMEKGTRFFDLQKNLALPDEDTVCEMYLKTIDTLASLGFYQYEISNFAKPGFESRHNLKYWALADYLGLGKTAHSLWHGKRFYYDRDFKIVPDGIGGTSDEKIMLGLRLNRGVKKNLIKKDYTRFLKLNLMRENGDNIALTPQGMLVSNYIIGELL